MPKLPLRESVFDTVCSLVGKTGRAFGLFMKHPLFIIGTGRCGTSLLVKILNAHLGLSGFPGEANELWHPKLEPFETSSLDIPPIEVDPKRFTDVSVANWPLNHGERIRDIFSGFHLITGPSRVFFTKSAMISFMIPKILELFPDARFVHIYRYGPSVVESYFKKNYGKYSRYKFTEKDYRLCCARYWKSCILEIEQRKTDLSLGEKGRFLEFSYESLCYSPKGVIDDIANFLGVDSDGFRYDTSRIISQNYKVEDYTRNPDRAELLDIMSTGLNLKGYKPGSLSDLS
jgi:hypothetical protein